MNLNQVHSVYFIGIGGIGMSALARYFNRCGMKVSGYDKTETELTKALQKEGISIHFDDAISLIPDKYQRVTDDVLVIYTPAIPANHLERNYLKDTGHRLYKRSEVLGLISKQYPTVAVAGTHGKTTTSSMVAYLLDQASVKATAFLGGIASNFESNLLLNDNSDWMVVEADEFDRSFLTLYPKIGVLTSMDADHLDIYGDHDQLKDAFQAFIKQIDSDGHLICRADLASSFSYDGAVSTYAIEGEATIQAENIRVENGFFVFDAVLTDQQMNGIVLGLPGYHNVENALATILVGMNLGLSEDQLRAGLKNFKGVKRRFEYQIRQDNLVFIDDYAHHPEELKATIKSVRKLYPDQKITGIFQPHLYTRTRDFADEFARSLEQLNELILLDIYPAREKPIEGIDSQMLLGKVQLNSKLLLPKKELVRNLKERKLEVLLTLGAGDIDKLVAPIREALQASVEENE